MLQTRRTINTGIVLVLALILGVVAVYRTTYSAPAAQDPMSKVVYVRGVQSYIMNGDSLNVDAAASGDKALPYFLTHGWRIQSAHVANNVEKGEAAGYFILERTRD
jgi:hypothetical protein